MKIDINDFVKGKFIKANVVNPRCDNYGPLQIVSVQVITEKFCTRWEDWGGYHRPLTSRDYVDRQTAIITVKNEKGKKLELRYWLDELTNPKYDFPNLVFLTSTDFKSAHEEVKKMVSAERLNRAHKEILGAIRGKYAEIFSHTKIVGGEQNEKIFQLVDELYTVLAKRNTKK